MATAHRRRALAGTQCRPSLPQINRSRRFPPHRLTTCQLPYPNWRRRHGVVGHLARRYLTR